MPIINIPGVGPMNFPDTMSNEDIGIAIRQDILPKVQKEGFGAGFGAGIQGLKSAYHGLKYGITEDEADRQALLASQAKEAEKYQGPGWEDVKEAFSQRGILHGLGRTWEAAKGTAGQSLPYLAAPVAAAALAPEAAVAGVGLGTLGFLGASGAQYTGTNVGRQVQEQEAAIARGETPQELSLGRAAAAAVPAALLDRFALGQTFKGTGLGKLFGQEGKEGVEAMARKIVETGGNPSKLNAVLSGGARGIAAEIPNEVGQQILERAQAGLDLTSDDAIKEYKEAAFGATLLGGGFGMGAGMGVRSAGMKTAAGWEQRAAEETEAFNKKEADRLKAMETTKTSILDTIRLANEREAARVGLAGDVREVGSAALDRALGAFDSPEGIDGVLNNMGDYFPGTPKAELGKLKVQLQTYKRRLTTQLAENAKKAEASAFTENIPDLFGEYRVQPTSVPEAAAQPAPAFELTAPPTTPAPVQGELNLEQQPLTPPKRIDAPFLKNYGIKAGTAVHKSLSGLNLDDAADMQKARTIIGDALASDKLSTKTQEKIDEMARKESRLQEQGEMFAPEELDTLQQDYNTALAEGARDKRNQGLAKLLADLETENAAKEEAQAAASAGVSDQVRAESTAGGLEPSVGVYERAAEPGTEADQGVSGQPLGSAERDVEGAVEATGGTGATLTPDQLRQMLLEAGAEYDQQKAEEQAAEAKVIEDEQAKWDAMLAAEGMGAEIEPIPTEEYETDAEAAARVKQERKAQRDLEAPLTGELSWEAGDADFDARQVATPAPAQGMTTEQTQGIVDRLKAGWKRNVKVAVKNFSDEKPGRQNAMRAYGLDTAKGYIDHDGTVVILANNNASEADVAATLFHESLGHLGLRLKFKEELATIMEQFYHTNAEMKRMANKWLFDHKGEYDEGMSPKEKYAKAVEEVLAERAEAGRLPASIMDKIKALINKYARMAGLKIKFSDAEIRAILDQAQQEVTEKTGEAKVGGETTARPGTTAFQNWFGNSKTVNEYGEPIVLYTGTSKDVDFKSFKVPKNGVWLTNDPAAASMYAKDNDSQGMKYEHGQFIPTNTASRVMPVYAKIENPYTITKADHDRMNVQNYKRAQGQFFDELRAKGYDGVDFGDGIWVVLKAPTQIKSAIGNKGTYSPTKPDITARSAAVATAEDLFNMAGGFTATPATTRALNKVKSTIDSFSSVEKLVNKINDTRTRVFSSDTKFNARLRNALQEAGLNWKDLMLTASTSQALHRGGLAERFLEWGTLTYDKAMNRWDSKKDDVNIVSMGRKIREIADKMGADPIAVKSWVGEAWVAKRLENIGNEIKALEKEIDAFATPKTAAQREYQATRTEKLELLQRVAELRTPEQLAAGLKLYDAIGADNMRELSDMKNTMRKRVLDMLVDTEVMTKEKAETFLENAEWVPFYRVTEEDETIGGPAVLSKGLSEQMKEKKLKGATGVDDTKQISGVDNLVKWLDWSVRRAVSNKQKRVMVDMFKEHVAEEIHEGKGNKGYTISVMEDGREKFYHFDDPLIAEAFTGMLPVMVPGMKAWRTATEGLRKAVTRFPLFPVAQIVQDTYDAMFTSGLKHPTKVITEVLREVYRTYKGESAARETLMGRGILSRDYSAAAEQEAAEVLAGLKEQNWWQRVNMNLERFSSTADHIVRQAVYNQSKAEGLSEQEALEKATEIINFRRQGSATWVNWMRTMVPFFGAYLQVQNVALKTLSGEGISPTERKAALAALGMTAAKVGLFSMVYSMIMGDDDDYQKMDRRTRDRMIMLPGTDVGIAIRPNVFATPKIFAEHMYGYLSDNGTTDGAKMRAAAKAALVDSVLPSSYAVPQLVRPALEVAMDHNIFLDRPIVGNLKNLEKAEQFTSSTSELAKVLGASPLSPWSPVQWDHLIRGYTSSVGSVVTLATNDAIAAATGRPRPDRSWQDTINSIPNMGNFVTKEFGTGDKTDFYELAGDVEKVNNTVNRMMKQGRVEEVKEYLGDEENKRLYAMRGQINAIQNNLAKVRAQKNVVLQAPEQRMSGAQKEVEIRRLNEIEQRMLANVGKLRKMAGF